MEHAIYLPPRRMKSFFWPESNQCNLLWVVKTREFLGSCFTKRRTQVFNNASGVFITISFFFYFCGNCFSWFIHFKGNELHHNVTLGVILSDHSLVLQSVTRDKAGDYTCLAANTEGKGTSNHVTLRVRCKYIYIKSTWKYFISKHVFYRLFVRPKMLLTIILQL